MKSRLSFLTVAFAAIVLCPMLASAQNLFRTGRPDYTRPQQNAWQQHPLQQNAWQRPSVANRYAESIGRVSNAAPLAATNVYRGNAFYANSGTNDDYHRMVSAWENYRREAMRYQQRYGDADFVNGTTTARPEYALAPAEDRAQCQRRGSCSLNNGYDRANARPEFERTGFGERSYDERFRSPADERPYLTRPLPRAQLSRPLSQQSEWQPLPTRSNRPASASRQSSAWDNRSSTQSRSLGRGGVDRDTYLDPARTASLSDMVRTYLPVSN